VHRRAARPPRSSFSLPRDDHERAVGQRALQLEGGAVRITGFAFGLIAPMVVLASVVGNAIR
jgi:hypothetical protein